MVGREFLEELPDWLKVDVTCVSLPRELLRVATCYGLPSAGSGAWRDSTRYEAFFATNP